MLCCWSIVTSHTNLQKTFSLIILFSLQKCHDDGIVAEAVPRVSVPGLHPPEPLPPGLQLQVSLQANSRQELYLVILRIYQLRYLECSDSLDLIDRQQVHQRVNNRSDLTFHHFKFVKKTLAQ